MSDQDLAKPKIVLVYARPGHGKTTLIKKYLMRLNYHHLYVIGQSIYDDYTPAQLAELDLKPESVVTNSDFHWEEIDEFRNREGIKVLVLDDVLHLETTSGHNLAHIRDLFSTSRHFQLYIFVSVQLLKSLGKALRFCCHVFITGNIDAESIELLSGLSGRKKNEFVGMHLKPHHFLCATNEGSVTKIVPTLNKKVYIDDYSSSDNEEEPEVRNTNEDQESSEE
jgi:hypothetical protein